ncbi:MAG: RNA 3'-terminal phosphate cyclase [Phycisphaerales bacterium]|nr:RNA 3'-terminal phosphate cyclase [Phycisphaerales bacterium]
MISLDGAMGEGGGQVLRTALSLSMCTGQPLRIQNIRANRPKPGLLRQHLTAVNAACAVCAGSATGAELGSHELTFLPDAIRAGDYDFAIGSAGSTTLVLQTILPALMTASGPSSVVLSGGTHNTHAPSVHFLQHAFLPLIERMGPTIRLDLERHGFYPAGGGQIHVHIEPTEQLKPTELLLPSPITGRRAIASVAGLSGSIAKRELAIVADHLGWEPDCLHIEQLADEVGPGNILSIEIQREDVTEVFTGFGERGVSAERVASNTVRDVQRYLGSNVPVWHYLADQLMLPLALAGGGAFRTGPLSKHAQTNVHVLEAFLGSCIQAAEIDGASVEIRAQPRR